MIWCFLSDPLWLTAFLLKEFKERMMQIDLFDLVIVEMFKLLYIVHSWIVLIISMDSFVYTYLSSFYLCSLTDNFQLIFVLISSVMISLDLWTLDKIDSYDILHLSIH